MSDMFCVHFKWVYTAIKRLGCYMFYNDLEDAGMIAPFHAILFIIWPSGLNIGIITLIHDLCVL